MVCLGHNEIINETTGFIPAEIIFGRNIRGPLYVMRNRWVDEVQSEFEQKKEVSTYMTELKSTLQDVADRAKENARKAQINLNKYFDRKSSKRKLKSGDRVLLLQPSSSHKLLEQWQGLFEVLRKMKNANYEIQRPRRKTILHINMLKKSWSERKL